MALVSSSVGLSLARDQPPFPFDDGLAIRCVLCRASRRNDSDAFLLMICFFLVLKQRVQIRNKLGYRDETKYQMSVGAGASNKYKRQG